jgi:pimeloyl-ACP methyl ester carboxylesterase
MLAFERIGSGEPLVLLHGIGHRRQAWYPVLDRVAAEREVVLVDLPGHGESPDLRLDGRRAPDAMAEELRKFFVEQDLQRPHVAGNSLGGRIALDIAATGDARSVTALSPAGFWFSPVDYVYTIGLFGTMIAGSRLISPLGPMLSRSAFGRWIMFRWINARPGALTPDQALGDFRAFLRSHATILKYTFSGAARFLDTIPGGVPVTVAWATGDVVLPRYQARRAAAHLPEATHVPMPRCGHVPMSDDPQLVADLLLRGSA